MKKYSSKLENLFLQATKLYFYHKLPYIFKVFINKSLSLLQNTQR